jgi:serine/threonine-protein kinase HipA
MGPIEFAYHLLAKEAGLNVPEAKLFASEKGPGYFGVKRFDSYQNKPLHVHTISGLLHADHRLPSLDYDTVLKATLFLTRDSRECEKQFRASVFNVLAHNRDDHGKNFSFIMDEKGVWRVSPAYDLTFSFGPAGEHCTTVMGEGKNPALIHMLKLSEGHGIRKNKALSIIEEVKNAVLKWPAFAKSTGVTEKSTTLIQKNLSRVLKGF